MTVSALVRASLSILESSSNAMGNPSVQSSIDFSASFGDGVGASQFDKAYIAERTVASATNDDVDLNAVITSLLANTFTAIELAGIFILNRQKDGTVNTTNLTIGGGSNPMLGLFSSMVLRPGAFVFAACEDAGGLAVITASTGDILRIANSSGAVNKYQIGLLGRSS